MKTKNQTGVWLDSTKAIIVTLTGSESSFQEVDADIENSVYHFEEGDKGSFMGERHLNNDRKFQERRQHQINKYLADVVELIGKSDEIVVVGPAQMKFELKAVLEDNRLLKDKLMSVETADKMSINQLIAWVKEYFNK